MRDQVKAAVIGSLIAFAAFAAGVVLAWPFIQERVVAGLKDETKKQGVASGAARDAVSGALAGLRDAFK